MGWIETSNTKATIFNFSPWSMHQEKLLHKISNLIKDKKETQDYGSFESVTFIESWLELQFEYNQLKNINFGVLFDSSNNPIWPNA